MTSSLLFLPCCQPPVPSASCPDHPKALRSQQLGKLGGGRCADSLLSSAGTGTDFPLPTLVFRVLETVYFCHPHCHAVSESVEELLTTTQWGSPPPPSGAEGSAGGKVGRGRGHLSRCFCHLCWAAAACLPGASPGPQPFRRLASHSFSSTSGTASHGGHRRWCQGRGRGAALPQARQGASHKTGRSPTQKPR